MSEPGVGELAELVEALANRVCTAEARLQEVAEATQATLTTPALWLVERDEDTDLAEYVADTKAAWARFVEWVVAIQRRYELSGMWLPRCWNQHGAVVEELTALWISHVDAYELGGKAPSSWHEAFYGALGRIREEWATDCRAGKHRVASHDRGWTLEDHAEVAASGPPLEHPNLPGSI